VLTVSPRAPGAVNGAPAGAPSPLFTAPNPLNRHKATLSAAKKPDPRPPRPPRPPQPPQPPAPRPDAAPSARALARSRRFAAPRCWPLLISPLPPPLPLPHILRHLLPLLVEPPRHPWQPLLQARRVLLHRPHQLVHHLLHMPHAVNQTLVPLDLRASTSAIDAVTARARPTSLTTSPAALCRSANAARSAASSLCCAATCSRCRTCARTCTAASSRGAGVHPPQRPPPRAPALNSRGYARLGLLGPRVPRRHYLLRLGGPPGRAVPKQFPTVGRKMLRYAAVPLRTMRCRTPLATHHDPLSFSALCSHDLMLRP